jgi:hypothetical protein
MMANRWWMVESVRVLVDRMYSRYGTQGKRIALVSVTTKKDRKARYRVGENVAAQWVIGSIPRATSTNLAHAKETNHVSMSTSIVDCQRRTYILKSKIKTKNAPRE